MDSIELWKEFVDTFAKLGDGVHFNWLVERGFYPDTPSNKQINDLLSNLTVEQRQVIAKMLISARGGGVHDALVALNDRFIKNNGLYSEQGVQMAFQPFETDLYYDYVCRREGDEWPDL